MTPNEVKAIAEGAAREAVRETLLTLGIDVRDPIKAQTGMAVLREVVFADGFAADMARVRKWCKAVDTVEAKGFLALIGFLVTGALGLIVVGVKTKFGIG